MEQADQLDQSGRKAEAVERYREALELWPDFDHGHYNLALCLQESGRLGEAQHHFDRTLELLPPPASPEDRRKRFDVLSRYGKLSTSIALGGGLDSAAVVEGVQLPARQSQALKAAARLLREAVRLEPTDGASRLALSQTLSVRGRGAEALEQLRQSVALSPADPAAMVELALGLHRHAAEKKTGKENLRVSGGGDGGASEELQATLDHAFRAAEPPKGVAKAVAAQFHSQLGMKLRRELPHAARRHFERALSLDPGHASASTSYYHLGSILRESGEDHAEWTLYEAAVTQGIWRHVAQRPGYLAAGVVANAGPWPAATDWPVLGQCIALLEEGFPQIREELLRSMAATEWDDDDHDDKTQPSGSSGTDGTIAPGVTDAATAAAAASARSAQSSWGARDLEGLTSSGEWQQSIYHRNGLRAATGDSFAARFPVTTRIVEKLLGLPSSSSSSGSGGVGAGLPKGSVEFSLLSEDTHIRPHCGPSNHKWRLHLGVLVPSNSSLRVGGLGDEYAKTTPAEQDENARGRRREWQEGEVLLFDDSFEHEVFHDGVGPRVVLIVDVWHPQLAAEGLREQVRRDFGWHANAVAA